MLALILHQPPRDAAISPILLLVSSSACTCTSTFTLHLKPHGFEIRALPSRTTTHKHVDPDALQAGLERPRSLPGCSRRRGRAPVEAGYPPDRRQGEGSRRLGILAIGPLVRFVSHHIRSSCSFSQQRSIRSLHILYHALPLCPPSKVRAESVW